MAIRVRKDGRLLCAAIHPEEPGDTYLHDGIHSELAGSTGSMPVIGAEPMAKHKTSGQWWWLGNVPEGVILDRFFLGTR